MSDSSVWGELFSGSAVEAPGQVLREYAAVIGEKSQYRLQGEVESWDYRDNLQYNLFVVAPSLGNYRYKIVTVGCNGPTFPVKVKMQNEELIANNESELRNFLNLALKNPEISRAIKTLFAESG